MRASLIVMPPPSPVGPSGPQVPVAIDIVGTTFRIPQERMADAPGGGNFTQRPSDASATT
ncbi:MAG: hypothetical protein AUI47_05275 [Acidobacteria bacterium 13_1_40CM_2_68_5]|nr:MAG: hypothetical protein AUI47_05275 [Acidobacteria bacterium 13_1_40CM_2_68_5]